MQEEAAKLLLTPTTLAGENGDVEVDVLKEPFNATWVMIMYYKILNTPVSEEELKAKYAFDHLTAGPCMRASPTALELAKVGIDASFEVRLTPTAALATPVTRHLLSPSQVAETALNPERGSSKVLPTSTPHDKAKNFLMTHATMFVIPRMLKDKIIGRDGNGKKLHLQLDVRICLLHMHACTCTYLHTAYQRCTQLLACTTQMCRPSVARPPSLRRMAWATA